MPFWKSIFGQWLAIDDRTMILWTRGILISSSLPTTMRLRLICQSMEEKWVAGIICDEIASQQEYYCYYCKQFAIKQNWMQCHTDSTPTFGQKRVRMHTTSSTWATTVQIATMDSCFALVWAHQHGIPCSWTELPRRIRRTPFNGQPHCNTCGRRGSVCQTDFANAYGVKIHY